MRFIEKYEKCNISEYKRREKNNGNWFIIDLEVICPSLLVC